MRWCFLLIRADDGVSNYGIKLSYCDKAEFSKSCSVEVAFHEVLRVSEQEMLI